MALVLVQCTLTKTNIADCLHIYMLSEMHQLLMAPFNCEASFFMGTYINHINHVTFGTVCLIIGIFIHVKVILTPNYSRSN